MVNMDNIFYTPSIGLEGLYSLSFPFDGSNVNLTTLKPDTAYTCTAVRLVSELISTGANPLSDYYQGLNSIVGMPDNATTDADGIAFVNYGNNVYLADTTISPITKKLPNAAIVTLQNRVGDVVHVPNRFITGFPILGGVDYQTLVIALNLGAVPDTMDLTYLKSVLVHDVMSIMGIASEAKVATIASPIRISEAEHDVIESARHNKIINSETQRAQIIRLTDMLTKAQAQIAALENWIKLNTPSQITTVSP